jgi:vacuolar-type H+-ATPase subunit F/Vma7
MSTIVAIGDSDELEGFVLVGVRVIPAATDPEIIDAWSNLDEQVGLVILSSAAARRLEPELSDRPDVLTVVMP